MTLPTILGFVVFALIAGFGVTITGYYVPFMIAGSMLLALGSGLLTTLHPGSSELAWTIFQIPLGAGGGFGVEQPYMAVMTVLKLVDVPAGVAFISFMQSLGSTLSITVAEAIFSACLQSGLKAAAAQSPNAQLANDSSGLQTGLDKGNEMALMTVYNTAITRTFYVAVVTGICAMIGALGMEWVSTKEKDGKSDID